MDKKFMIWWYWNRKKQISLPWKFDFAYDVGIDKIMISNKFFCGKNGFKYFIGYKDNKKIRSLCKMPLKLGAYKRDFDETKYISFFDKRW